MYTDTDTGLLTYIIKKKKI